MPNQKKLPKVQPTDCNGRRLRVGDVVLVGDVEETIMSFSWHLGFTRKELPNDRYKDTYTHEYATLMTRRSAKSYYTNPAAPEKSSLCDTSPSPRR